MYTRNALKDKNKLLEEKINASTTKSYASVVTHPTSKEDIKNKRNLIIEPRNNQDKEKIKENILKTIKEDTRI